MDSDGDVDNYGRNVTVSYGTLRVLVMLMVHIELDLMAIVWIVVVMELCMIPTGYLLYQENFKFHSPYLDYNISSYAYHVYPDGRVAYNINMYDSCGRSSPDVNNNYHILSCYIESDGISSNDFFYGDNVRSSYGNM